MPALPGLRSAFYVVLRDISGETAWTTMAAAYFTLVKTGDVWRPDAISRAFASKAEALAYVIGAGRGELPARRL